MRENHYLCSQNLNRKTIFSRFTIEILAIEHVDAIKKHRKFTF